MSSDVDICNMALGYLGDDAVVASISPSDSSAQADHCARFYPIARDSLLEMHAWGFASKRASLALLSGTPPSPWLYSYAQPADALNILAVLDPAALDDFSVGQSSYGNTTGITNSNGGAYTPQNFTCEVDANDAEVIYTNQVNAVLRYTKLVTDPNKYTPLFTETLAWLLAAKLAGPILKGDSGVKAAMVCMKQFDIWFAKATASDANQQRHQTMQRTDWLSNR